MRIEQLEQVIRIVEAGSISRAAQALFMTQSNLSQSVKRLEEELGQVLFRRSAGGVELTPFGNEFLIYARPAYTHFQLLGDYCRQQRQGAPVSFSMACQYFRFAHLLFLQLRAQYSASPNQFSFFECSFSDIVHKVAAQQAELGLVVISKNQKRLNLQLFKNRGLSYVHLAEYPAAVIVGVGHPLYHWPEEGISLDMLTDYPAVFFSDMSFNYTSELETLNFHRLHDRITVSDRATLHEVLEHTDAYSIAVYTKAYSPDSYYPNIRALKLLDKRFVMEVGYIHSMGRPLSVIGTEYLSMLRELLAVDEHEQSNAKSECIK